MLLNIKLLSIIIISCLGIIVYSNTYHCSFHFDDFSSIVTNPNIRHIHDLHHIWKNWPSRFITYLSIALNYHFYGVNVYGYHLVNFLVHLITSLLVWWLVRLTLLTPAMKGNKIADHGDWVALFAGLIFLTHPLQTQAVTYIIQRAASMATMFYVASLCLYIKSRLLQHEKSASKYYIGSLICAVFAMFCKEMAISLPLMVLLYEYSFFPSNDRLKSKSLGPYWFILGALLLTMVLTHSVNFQELRRATEKPSELSSVQYLMVQFRVIVTYLRLVILPLGQNIDYDYPAAKTIFGFSTLMSFLFLGAILIAAKKLYSKYTLISFSILWFFLALLPESSFWPIRDVIVEHRLYLPMVGYSLFLVSGAYYWWGKDNFRSMAIVLSMIIACNAVLTFERNKTWKNEFTLWDDTVHKSPHKARPYINRGLARYNEANFAKAVLDYNRAIELDPDASDVFYDRGLANEMMRQFNAAIADYNSCIKIDPKNADAYYNQGNAYFKEGRFDLAIDDFTKAIKINPRQADPYNNRGLAYSKLGNFDQAFSDYSRAIKLNPKDRDAYHNLGLLKQNQEWINR